jgi:hypothetical protein
VSPDAELAAVTLAAVSIKLPTFWADNPEDWFRQAEAQFDLSNVTTQRTKFHHVLVVLPKEVINSDTGVIHIWLQGRRIHLTPQDPLLWRLHAAQVDKEVQADPPPWFGWPEALRHVGSNVADHSAW